MTLIQVSIDRLALREIEEELRYSAAELRDGAESGGWLWAAAGAAWWRAEGLLIEAACGPGRKAKREPGALTLDGDHFDAWDAEMRKLGLECCGFWHTHPGGDDQPSETDEKRIEALLHFREEWGARTPRVLELILTPAGTGWTATPGSCTGQRPRAETLPPTASVPPSPPSSWERRSRDRRL